MEQRTISSASKVVASGRQTSTDLDGEAIILHFDAGLYYALENVGARTWELLRQPRTVAELRDALVTEYEVDPDRCEADLQSLLSELTEAGLIEVIDESAS
jgi:hypothetical protein